MESLLVLILSVVVSGILAAQQKKKASRNIPHPDEHTAPSSSPWDDLMRELRNGPDRTEHSSPAVESAEEEFLENRMPLEEPRASFGDMTPEQSDKEPLPYFTYDDQTLAEWSSMSEPAPAAPLSKRDTATSPQAAPSVPEHTEHNESPFAEGFDPRMGVLYAEIMTPKFRQY